MLGLGDEIAPLPTRSGVAGWIPTVAPGNHGSAKAGKNQGIAGQLYTGRAGTTLCVKEVWQLYGGLCGPSHPKVEKLITISLPVYYPFYLT